MDWKTRIRKAFAAAGHVPADAVIEELAEYAADLERDALDNGLSPDASAARVGEHIVVWVRDTPYRTQAPPRAEDPVARRPWMKTDITFALRMIVRQPGASLAGVMAIALAIAAVAVIAALVWRVVYQPLPWPESDRLVRIYEGRRGGSATFGQFGAIMTNGSYLAWQQAPTTIEGLGAWSDGEHTLSGEGPAERILTANLTPSLLSILRIPPSVGRLFRDDDTPAGASPVALVSDVFWRQRLGGRADAVGSVIRLDGDPVTIVGVMPALFAFPDSRTEVWLPLHVTPTVMPGSQNGSLQMFNALARLAPGASVEQAVAEATSLAQAAPQADPVFMAVFGSNGPVEMRIVPVLDDQIGAIKPALLVLLAAVGLLLVASACNVANVQLARSLARRRELAIRAALGADAKRLAGQLLVESLVLGAIGGLVGLGLALPITAALPAWLPDDFPRLDQVTMDWRGATAAVLGALLAGVLAGILPAWHARRSLSATALTEDGQSTIGLAQGSAAARMRTAAMAFQVTIATILLVGSTLLGRSFFALLDVDRGFDTTYVLSAELPITGETGRARRQAILDATVARLEAVPGVVAAGYTNILPLSGSENIFAFEMGGRDGRTAMVRTSFRVVSHDYMRALGMRVREGRLFHRRDTSTSQRVAVVNRAFALQYLDDSPLDSEIPGTDGENPPPFRVIGVVDSVRSADGTQVGPEMFVTEQQWAADQIGGNPVLAIRTVGAPREIAPVVRGIVADVDPTLAVGRIATMEERVIEQLARPRLYSVLMAAFAALALSVAAVGLFGVLSFSIAQRSRELAVRSALGATPGALLRLVLRQGVAVTSVGVVLGIALSLALAGTLRQWLYGFSGTDPATYVAVALVMLAVAAIACSVPALRAARLDPLVVLKRG